MGDRAAVCHPRFCVGLASARQWPTQPSTGHNGGNLASGLQAIARLWGSKADPLTRCQGSKALRLPWASGEWELEAGAVNEEMGDWTGTSTMSEIGRTPRARCPTA